MIKRAQTTKFTTEEYLAFEEASLTKHEFYQGKVYAMSGGTPDHSLIAGNMGDILRHSLADSPCRVFTSDLRVLIQETKLYTYPDLSIVCGKLEYDPRSKTTITNPIVLVEVLSPSTRAYDRGDKFKFYKQIASLQEVILIEAERPHVEVLRRAARGKWTIDMFDGLEAVAALSSVQCQISLRQVYAKVSWRS